MVNYCFLFVIVFFSISGCNNNDRNVNGNGRSGGKSIFFDYKIRGDEESGEVVVNLQFREGGLDGSPTALLYPSQVTFDEEILPVDSSKMNGFYYEITRPAENFAGPHSIVFSDENKKEYKEEFDFPILALTDEVTGSTLHRREYSLKLSGVDSIDFIRLLITDTSFYSRGVDRTDTIKNGEIIITERDFENLKNGPVFLEIYKESDRPLKETVSGGGSRLFLSYGLRRAFELRR